MGDAQYFSEFECDPTSPIIGAYFGQEIKDCDIEGRLEPNLAVIDGPIHTAWDLGNQSNMAVWCFQAGDEGLRIIDFICEPNWFFKDYINALNRREYTRRRGNIMGLCVGRRRPKCEERPASRAE